jgi:hypothetical protein
MVPSIISYYPEHYIILSRALYHIIPSIISYCPEHYIILSRALYHIIPSIKSYCPEHYIILHELWECNMMYCGLIPSRLRYCTERYGNHVPFFLIFIFKNISIYLFVEIVNINVYNAIKQFNPASFLCLF